MEKERRKNGKIKYRKKKCDKKYMAKDLLNHIKEVKNCSLQVAFVEFHMDY